MISITCFILFFYLILQLSEKAIYYQKYIKQMTFESHNSLKQHCVKSVRIRSYSGSYFPAFGLNTGQNNSECGHFSRSAKLYQYLRFSF